VRADWSVAGAEGLPAGRELTTMAVREDCRHYSSRSLPDGDLRRRCRLDANEEAPFACPEGCVFFEPRAVSDAGWQDEG
jgi:hypothetical protein